MTVAEIVATILTAFAGGSLFSSFTLFAGFVIKSIKEKPAEKLLGGFVISFILAILFIFVALIFLLAVV